jgi:hypothetical protein
MKTVAQIALEIGVTKQAIHDRRKREPLKSQLESLTERIDNTLYVNLDGETLIKSLFNKKSSRLLLDDSTRIFDEPTRKLDEVTSDFIKILQEQIIKQNEQIEKLQEELKTEREHSREQADKILQLAQQGQRLAENAQTLQAMENVKPQLTEEKKRGLFNIFSRKKHE